MSIAFTCIKQYCCLRCQNLAAMELLPATSDCVIVFLLFLLLTSINLVCFAEPSLAAHLTNETDRFALIAFKDKIYVDPNRVLSSWSGVTCSTQHPQRVTALNLTNLNLVGYLSPYIGNLSFKRIIQLRNNSFQGQISQEIGYLRRLQYLNLDDNSFNGEIPKNLTVSAQSANLARK